MSKININVWNDKISQYENFMTVYGDYHIELRNFREVSNTTMRPENVFVRGNGIIEIWKMKITKIVTDIEFHIKEG